MQQETISLFFPRTHGHSEIKERVMIICKLKWHASEKESQILVPILILIPLTLQREEKSLYHNDCMIK